MQDKGLQEQERINWVLERLGYGKSCLSEYQETFGLSMARFYEDRRRALEVLKERIGEDGEKWKNDIIERLETIYANNINSPRNQNVALDVLQTLAKITGNLEDKVKVEAVVPTIKWEKNE